MTKKSKSDVAIERARLDAIELRAQGFSYTKIAERLGSPRSTVWDHIQKACDQLRQEQYQHADALRTQAAFRMEKLLQVFMPLAEAGDVTAADMVLKITRDLSKLFSLNMPEQTNVQVDDKLEVVFRGTVPEPDAVLRDREAAKEIAAQEVEDARERERSRSTEAARAREAEREETAAEVKAPVRTMGFDPIFGSS